MENRLLLLLLLPPSAEPSRGCRQDGGLGHCVRGVCVRASRAGPLGWASEGNGVGARAALGGSAGPRRENGGAAACAPGSNVGGGRGKGTRTPDSARHDSRPPAPRCPAAEFVLPTRSRRVPRAGECRRIGVSLLSLSLQSWGNSGLPSPSLHRRAGGSGAPWAQVRTEGLTCTFPPASPSLPPRPGAQLGEGLCGSSFPLRVTLAELLGGCPLRGRVVAVSVRLPLFFFCKERALANLCRGRPMPGAACCWNPAGLSPASVGEGGRRRRKENASYWGVLAPLLF